MTKNLEKILLSAGLIASLIGCRARSERTFPIHNSYEDGSITVYDKYNDGKWDFARRTTHGFTLGQYSDTLYIKEGYSIPQTPNNVQGVRVVKPDFFKPYQ